MEETRGANLNQFMPVKLANFSIRMVPWKGWHLSVNWSNPPSSGAEVTYDSFVTLPVQYGTCTGACHGIKIIKF